MNIGANAHAERTVSTKQPQVTDYDLRWQLGFQGHWRGIELVFKSLDCFTKRLFHSVTIFFAATYVFVVWNFTRLITRLKIFLNLDLVGSTQFQCIYELRCILISRPPRVISAFQTSLLFKCVSLNVNVAILTAISLKFVSKGAIDNQPALDNGLARNRQQAIICSKDALGHWCIYASPGLDWVRQNDCGQWY